MTKQEEREVLKKIEKLIASTGEDSYIQKAFEGAVQIAAENIDNDFFDSWKDRAERRASETLKYRDAAEEADAKARRAEQEKTELETIVNNLRGAEKSASDSARENWNKRREAEDEAEALKQQVIELKARLYDFMVKG